MRYLRRRIAGAAGDRRPVLANLPWEYVYVERSEGEQGLDGFLALDPRIAFVRHEALARKPGSVAATHPLKVVVGLAGPAGEAPLDLAEERGYIEEALAGVVGVEASFVEHLTVEKFETAIQGAQVFHFGGHGAFVDGATGVAGTRHLRPIETASDNTGQQSGAGVLVFEDERGGRRLFAADKLAQNLASLRLVVLGACETGRRDGVNVWSGIAPALLRVGIPAVVAMQYAVYDRSAIAFARRFYQAIASGLALDEAMTVGRLAVLNLAAPYDLDFGVPVLYLRAADGLLFPAVAEEADLVAQREAARLVIRQRMREVRGTVMGLVAETGALPSGVQAEVGQKIDRVEAGGIVTGMVLGGEGGSVHVGGEQQYVTNRSVFDQRGQTVQGAQTNIEGGVHTGGGIFNSGVINQGAAPMQADLIGELRTLLAMVKQAGEQGLLDEERVIDVESALRKAVLQAEKGQLNGEAILGHLRKAQATMAEVAPAHSLAVAIQKLVGMVDRRQ
ncbi:MAG: CHAT domain-containing protein [Caldilineaceae bacterium]